MHHDMAGKFGTPGETVDALTELLREGAQRLLSQAVEAELEEFLARQASRQDVQGRRAVVHNGHLPQREMLTGIGPVAVRVPKVRDRSGGGVKFNSALVPQYVRTSRSVEAALPWLYLKGISSGQMQEALEVLVGKEARGLSATTVGRLKAQWTTEYARWCARKLDQDRWVYLWADGIYSGLRGEQGRLCVLVIIGVNTRGQKRLLAIEDGGRESTQSWREVLLGLKARGLTQAPAVAVAVGDGALGFWAALEEVYPETRAQRCWVHKTMNVLNDLPKAAQPKAKAALQAIWMAETKGQAQTAFGRFAATYEAKYPKAAHCLVKDRDAMLSVYDFPAEHWIHIRSSNVIESSFGTIRHRSDRAKGCVTRQTMLAMIFKLGMCAEQRWKRLRGFDYLAKVIAGVQFKDGIEQSDDAGLDRSRAAA